jgi:hypothetical protein
MKSKEEIQKKINDLKEDDRYKRKPASVDINAPLALIQVSIGSMVDILEWVLKDEKENTD